MTPPSPGHARPLVLAVVVLLVGTVMSAAQHHHKKTHHHQDPRAPRTRREQDGAEEATTGSGDSVAGTEVPEQFPCSGTSQAECSGLANSKCDKAQGLCVCLDSHPVRDPDNPYCGKATKLNEKCKYSSECMENNLYAVCGAEGVCTCRPGFMIDDLPDIGINCIETNKGDGPGGVDPAMIGVLAGLGLMFVIICVVLRLFSKARFRENRSIFNTPNPRLMNASLFKDSKLLSPARGERRGSRASVRAPSRAASVTSVNAASRSPNGSLAKG